MCKVVLEKDGKARKELDIPAPTLEEFQTMRGLPRMTPADAHHVLIRLGVITEDRRRRGSPNHDRKGDRDRSGNRRRSDSDRKHGSFRRSPDGRRSPYQRRKLVFDCSYRLM